jgi:hypothetical protein
MIDRFPESLLFLKKEEIADQLMAFEKAGPRKRKPRKERVSA